MAADLLLRARGFSAYGVRVFFLASILWLRVVAAEPLSLAYPISASITFSLVAAGAAVLFVLFSEGLTLRKVVDLAVVLTGMAVISNEKGTTI